MQSEIARIESQLRKLPDGKLFIVRNGKYSKWYKSGEEGIEYINKRRRNLAEELAYKKFLCYKLEILKDENRRIASKSKRIELIEAKLGEMVDDERYMELLTGRIDKENVDYFKWMNQEYEKNGRYPEALKHKTVDGLSVRSKSEAMIALCLSQNGMPYRYEWALDLNGRTIYPDFTIIKPSTGKMYRWEHFGRMDDPKYLAEFNYKMELYSRNGILAGDNLILTFENGDHPLSLLMIENMINIYLK